VHVDSEGQITVVGTAVRNELGTLREISPLLDTPVTLVKATRSVNDTIESILAAVRSATSKEVLFAVGSRSLFMTTQAEIGGNQASARDLLNQALASTKRPLQYDLFFNPDMPIYILNVSPAMGEKAKDLEDRSLFQFNRPQ
jgi:hypothetical protein